MRKHHQNQAFNLLEQMRKLQADELYAECQEVALFLCDFIDSAAGEGTKTVDMLVAYCELLFKAHNGENVKNAIKKQIINIGNSIKSELKPNRIEVAFITYKAAQSDALESIYLEAKKDPDCDAFWIPVPYNTKNKDKSLSEPIFEGEGYYDERFEITDYKEYDMEARRPDAIFTFCPYDGKNPSIQIHKDYYTKRMRNFTDMLVYVQYNVPNVDVAEADMSGQEKFEQLRKVNDYMATGTMRLAAYHNAHKVISHTPSVSRWHEYGVHKVYEEEAKVKLGSRAPEFIGLGSPKIDKVIGYKRENFYMPPEWLEIIEGKKVFLYNVAVTGLGRQRASVTQLAKVILAFEKRNDIVLWLRPHPHLKAFITHYSPYVLESYEKLIEKYKAGRFGIFDETTDFHRAMAWTDAYYGDGSSLLKLYPFTGKPAMRSMSKIEIQDLTEETDFDVTSVDDRLDTVKSFDNYAFDETEEFGLREFIAFVLSDANTAEKTEARKQMYINAYANPNKTASEAIYENVKGSIFQKWD